MQEKSDKESYKNSRAPKLKFQKARNESIEGPTTALAYSFEQEDAYERGQRVTYRQESTEIYNVEMPQVHSSRRVKEQQFPYWMLDPNHMENIAALARQFDNKKAAHAGSGKGERKFSSVDQLLLPVKTSDSKQKTDIDDNQSIIIKDQVSDHFTDVNLPLKRSRKGSFVISSDSLPIGDQLINHNEMVENVSNIGSKPSNEMDINNMETGSHVKSEDDDHVKDAISNKDLDGREMGNSDDFDKKEKQKVSDAKALSNKQNLKSLSHIPIAQTKKSPACNHKLENKHRGCQVCFECGICKEEFVRKDLPPSNERIWGKKEKTPKCPKCGTFNSKATGVRF